MFTFNSPTTDYVGESAPHPPHPVQRHLLLVAFNLFTSLKENRQAIYYVVYGAFRSALLVIYCVCGIVSLCLSAV